MNDEEKAREQLIDELRKARQHIAALEAERADGTGESLQTSEERYRRLVEEINDIIYTVDREKIVTYISPVIQGVSGYAPSEITGHPFTEFIYPEDVSLVEKQFLENISGRFELAQFRFRVLTKSGQVRWARTFSRPILEGGRVVGLRGVMTDVTGQAQTESALRQRNRELEWLNRAGHAFLSTRDLDHVLAAVLDDARHLLGVTACSAWLVDAGTGELVCRQVTNPQSEIVLGWRLAPGQGLAGWTVQHGQSLNVPDIRMDERHFKGVDEQTGLPLRAILTVPLKIQDDVIGVLQAVGTEVDCFSAMDVTVMESLASAVAGAVENARLYEQVQGHASELEQRVAERTFELARAYERLQELDRLKSKFIADISHELRTPLTNIRLYTQLLQDGKPQKFTDYLAVIDSQTSRLVRLVEDILLFSQSEPVAMTFGPVDLNEVVEQIVDDYRPRADAADLALLFEPGDGLPPVRAQSRPLAQLVTELVDNAILYTTNGHVRIRTYLAPGEDRICLEVKDTGRGISPEDLPHVFERFYRGHGVGSSNIPGSGLGLAVAKEIAESHEAEIEVESQVGQGSTVKVWLPLAETA